MFDQFEHLGYSKAPRKPLLGLPDSCWSFWRKKSICSSLLQKKLEAQERGPQMGFCKALESLNKVKLIWHFRSQRAFLNLFSQSGILTLHNQNKLKKTISFSQSQLTLLQYTKQLCLSGLLNSPPVC